MAILQKLNSKANLRKTSGGDLPYQTSYPVIARYEADSTASQTLINMTFSVDQANKESFQLFIDGKLLREGSSNDFTFTSIQADNTSSQITLNAPIDANLNIVAIKLGLRVDSLSSGSSAVSSGGSKNYFSLNNANPDFEKNVTSPWLPCTLTWSGTAPSGAPTLSATDMTLSVSNSNPLIGSYSMLLTKAAANSQYQGLISGGLTIDREDVAKVLYGSFSYELVSGTVDFSGTSTQTYEIWVWNYDPASPSVGQWIQPAGYRGMNQSSGVGKVVFSFQTDGTFTNNAYKVAVITQQTGTGAIVVKFDDFLLGPQAIVLGSAMTDWQSYTPTLTGFGTVAFQSFRSRRVGDTLEVEGYLQMGTGSPVNASFTLGYLGQNGNVNIDGNKITLNAVVGNVGYNQNSSTFFGAYVLALTAGNTLNFSQQTSTTNNLATPMLGSAFGTGSVIQLRATVPIAGWSSSSQVSSDTDTRVVAARMYRNAAFTTSAATTALFPLDSVASDTGGMANTSTNRITVTTSGWYNISGTVSFAVGATPGSFGSLITINGTNVLIADGFGQNSYSAPTASGVFWLKAGDYVELYYYSSISVSVNTGSARSSLSVTRVSGPSVITATETVAAFGQTISFSVPHNAWTAVSSLTIVDSTHNALTTGGVFTAPVSGRYQVSGTVNFSANGSGVRGVRIRKNGLDTGIGCLIPPIAGNVTGASSSGYVKLIAGDTVSFEAFQTSGAALSVSTFSDVASTLSIVRVGN